MTNLDEKSRQIEDIIYKFLPEEVGHQKIVLEAMNYTMKAGGKRLRPMLMDETYKLFGGEDRTVIEPFMAAIEMIHTYSLIHDDLPALDNDDYRRGRETAHIKYGEDIAILAGDGLLNYAYEIASNTFTGSNEDIVIAKAMKILSSKPGIYGMIGGQTADVHLTGHRLDSEQLEYIYENKTGALIEASMMIGAILAGANDKDVDTVNQVASDVGMAFQIQDDILDIIGEQEVIGKPVHSDETNDKITYATIHGFEKAKEDVALISKRAVDNLNSLPYSNPFLSELIISLVNRTK